MNIPTKKLKSGFELPVYGLGLWQIGGGVEADYSEDEAQAIAIGAAIDAGITHIDTAESYGDGHAEEILSRVLPNYDRNKLFIASKVSAHNQGYDELMRSFESSMNRLSTPYLDLYMLHKYPDVGIDIADTMKAMDELVRQGVVKNIGVSNMTPVRFDEAQRHTANKIVCNQVHYNVQCREIEQRGVLEHGRANDVMITAWRPLQKGMLPDVPLIQDIAKKYNKTPMQIAINWLTSQRNVVTIAKTSSVEHLRENLGALDFTMSDEDVKRIRNEYPDQQMVSDAVPLAYEAAYPA